VTEDDRITVKIVATIPSPNHFIAKIAMCKWFPGQEG